MKKYILVIFILFSLAMSEQGAKYLIITPDMFSNIIRPLADWKTKKGIISKVVTFSEIGNNPTLIRNYIYDAYHHWNIRPEYVLLVGSGIRFPAVGNSDDYYADLTGTGNPLIELSIGRFPCTYPRQCSTMVAKTLRYERNPWLVDTTWYIKGTTIVDNDWVVDSIYWENSRYVHNFWRNNQYVHIDSFSTFDGDSTDDVINAINDGRVLVTYRGLATANWWHFPINPDQTNNGYKLPMIVSGTCATMSLLDTSYLGARFLNAGTPANFKGSVGFFGTTIATSGEGLSTLRGTVFKGFFRSVYQDNIYKMGDAAKRAKFILDSIRPFNYTEMRYKEWNLFGDPELPIFTGVPRSLTVIHDTIILTGPQNYNVLVTQAGNPVTNALVCLMMDSIIYQTGYTSSSGLVSFTIYSPYPGTMSVTVTAKNSVPYEKNVNIQAGGSVHDIGIISISEPTAQVGAGILVNPKVRIKNWGGYTDTFSITFKIGSSYNNAISQVIIGAGDTSIVSFPQWNAVIGNYPVAAYITFNRDQWHANDTSRISISVIAPNDVGIDAIINPDTMQTINKLFVPKAKIKNYGSLPQINFPVACSIFGQNAIVRYTNTKTISLAAGRDSAINFFPWTPVVNETCTIKISTSLAGDENPVNNTQIRYTRIVQSYLENFEGGNGGYTSNPPVNGWQWGKVNYGPYLAHSGTKCWATGLNSNYTNNANWKLTTPELTATTNYPSLKFWHWYNTDEYFDGGNVKISIDSGATWQLLIPQTGYNGFVINVNPAIPNESCYSGVGDWSEAIFNLPVITGQHFRIRFHFGSDNYLNFPGWFIDDITGIGISAPSQRANDIALDSIMYPINNIALNVLQYPYALVKNWGVLEQTNFPVTCSIVNTNGVLRYSDTKIISLAEGRDTFVYFTSWLPTSTEICTVKMSTRLTNDENTSNDRKRTPIEVRWVLFDYGFEDPYFPPAGWVTYNNDNGTQSWIRGTLSPHSGAGSAESRFESSTLRNDDWIVTPATNILSNSAELRFWYHAHVTQNYESLQVRLSTTGNAINDFNTVLGDYRFNSTTYSECAIPLNGYNGQNIYLAFINKGLYQRKIYLDDIMIKGFTLGIEEQSPISTLPKTMLYPIKPNPIVHGAVNINFSLAEPSQVSLKIFDASGRIVRTLSNNQQLTTDNYSLIWNCRDDNNRKVAEGIYFCTLETPKQKLTRKMVFTR